MIHTRTHTVTHTHTHTHTHTPQIIFSRIHEDVEINAAASTREAEPVVAQKLRLDVGWKFWRKPEDEIEGAEVEFAIKFYNAMVRVVCVSCVVCVCVCVCSRERAARARLGRRV